MTFRRVKPWPLLVTLYQHDIDLACCMCSIVCVSISKPMCAEVLTAENSEVHSGQCLLWGLWIPPPEVLYTNRHLSFCMSVPFSFFLKCKKILKPFVFTGLFQYSVIVTTETVGDGMSRTCLGHSSHRTLFVKMVLSSGGWLCGSLQSEMGPCHIIVHGHWSIGGYLTLSR